MSASRREAKLLPLSLYRHYEPLPSVHSLLSRDRNRISGRKNKYTQKEVDLCIKSFNWMYRNPVALKSSYHYESTLGKNRKIRLPPIQKPQVPSNPSLEHFLQSSSLKLTSVAITFKDKKLFIPLSDIKHVIFAPEGEVSFNVSKCLKDNIWALGSSLYSNYDDVKPNYLASYFLPSMELSVFLAKAVQSRQVGAVIQKFEEKGLVMKYCRMVQNDGPCLLMAWQGCESKLVSEKILKTFKFFFEFIDWEKAKKFMPENSQDLIDEPVQSLNFRVGNQYCRLTFPMIQGKGKPMAVPLGILKQMIESNFSNWAEIWKKSKKPKH